MTVGTGIGASKEGTDSLAHGLLESIKHHRPDKIVFFGSKLSKEIVNSILKQHSNLGTGDFPQNELVLIHSVDNFNDCFSAIKKEIEKYQKHEIIIDYTSGTKTMTMSAAICSVLYRKELSLISGKRGENGLVIRGTEKIETQNLYQVYDELIMEKVKDFFNNHRFHAAQSILKDTVDIKNRGAYLKLIKAYEAWDMFDHQGCRELLMDKELEQIPEIKETLSKNKKIIGILTNPKKKEKGRYMVADLLNNARRRGEEQKYDDAVARLYRAIELIAQSKLKEKYDIDTSDVDINKLSELTKVSMKNDLDRNKSSDGKIKVGMHLSYSMLRYEGDETGRKFASDNELKNFLTKRNNSILAHGLDPISRKNYEKLLDKTIGFGKEAFPDLEELMKSAMFPKL